MLMAERDNSNNGSPSGSRSSSYATARETCCGEQGASDGVAPWYQRTFHTSLATGASCPRGGLDLAVRLRATDVFPREGDKGRQRDNNILLKGKKPSYYR